MMPGVYQQCCSNCGKSFSGLKEVFDNMVKDYVQEYYKNKFEEISANPQDLRFINSDNLEYKAIYDELKIDKLCCKQDLSSDINFHKTRNSF